MRLRASRLLMIAMLLLLGAGDAAGLLGGASIVSPQPAQAAGELTDYTVTNVACGGQGAGQHDFNGTVYMICGTADQNDPGGRTLRVVPAVGSPVDSPIDNRIEWATDAAPVHGGAYVFLATDRVETQAAPYTEANPKRTLRRLKRQQNGSYALDTVNNVPWTLRYNQEPNWNIIAEGRFIASDANNNLYIAFGQDTYNNPGAILQFSVAADGTMAEVRRVSQPNLLGVAVTASGGTMYTLEAANSSASKVRQWTPSGGTWASGVTFGTGYNPNLNNPCSDPSNQDGKLAYPYDLGLDSAEQHVYVINTACGRVEKFTTGGSHVGKKQLVDPTACGLPCNRPHGLAVVGNGDVYIPQVGKMMVKGTPPDTTPPTTMNITAPTANQVVGNGFTVRGHAVDNAGGSGIKQVEFRYCQGTTCAWTNGARIGQIDTSAPYEQSWTGQPPNGQYAVIARATDNASPANTKDSEVVLVTVSNGGAVLPFSDGFESGDLTAWTSSNNMTVQSTHKVTGGFGAQAQATNGTAYARKNLGGAQPDVYAWVRFKVVADTGPVALLGAYDPDALSLFRVEVNDAGFLVAKDSYNAQWLDSSRSIAVGTWYELQLRVKVVAGTGAIDTVGVWLNGVYLPELSGTRHLGDAGVGIMQIGEVDAARSPNVAFDDVAVQTSCVGGVSNCSTSDATMELDKDKSKYNGLVTATLTGFTPGSTVTLKWQRPYEITSGPDKGQFTDVLATGTVNITGYVALTFRTPLEPLGNYTITAQDTSGISMTATLRVIPRIMLNETSGSPSTRLRVYFYGFAPGDRIEVRWHTGSTTESSYKVIKTITVASNGRSSTLIPIPSNQRAGQHLIVGKVVGVSRSASTSFTLTSPSAAAETPTPEPTETPEATPEPTLTPAPDASPIAAAGGDQTVTDADGTGEESVQLTGSGSTDPEGGQLVYQWSEGQTVLSTEADPVLSLSVGTHVLALSVMDEAGNVAVNEVVVVVEAQPGDETTDEPVDEPVDDGTTDGSTDEVTDEPVDDSSDSEGDAAEETDEASDTLAETAAD